jgi:fluoride exporter
MLKILLVLLGGALGTGLRYGLSTLITSVFRQPEYPYGTFIINVTGSFAIGILASLFAARPWASDVARAALMTGVLGGYTTFSSFSLETYTLLQDGRAGLAILYVAASVLLGLGAVWAGMRFAQVF